jgi:hypothetical protein
VKSVAILNVEHLPPALYRKRHSRAGRVRQSVAREVSCLFSEALDASSRFSILHVEGVGKDLWRDQLVAALGNGCTTFLTNDRRPPPRPELRIVRLSSYVA